MKIFNFKIILTSFFISCFSLGIGILSLDKIYPSLPCHTWEKLIPQGYKEFNRVSLSLWASLCVEKNFIISASEGTHAPSFPEIFKEKYKIDFSEMKGAHRGIKSAAYLASHQIHEDRKKDLKIIILVNPFYWTKYGAKTDDAAIYRTSLSSFSFNSRLGINSTRKKELLIETPFIVSKNFFDELNELQTILKSKPLPRKSLEITNPVGYDLEHHMEKSFYSSDSKKAFNFEFPKDVQPTKDLLDKMVASLEKQKISYCVVRLPLNELYMRQGRGDVDLILQQIEQSFSTLPANRSINVEHLGRKEFVFKDTIHFTEYGKLKVVEEIVNSSCFKDLGVIQ